MSFKPLSPLVYNHGLRNPREGSFAAIRASFKSEITEAKVYSEISETSEPANVGVRPGIGGTYRCTGAGTSNGGDLTTHHDLKV